MPGTSHQLRTVGSVAIKYVQMNKGLWIKTTDSPLVSDLPGRGVLCEVLKFWWDVVNNWLILLILDSCQRSVVIVRSC